MKGKGDMDYAERTLKMVSVIGEVCRRRDLLGDCLEDDVR
jgi:hypothetical protein